MHTVSLAELLNHRSLVFFRGECDDCFVAGGVKRFSHGFDGSDTMPFKHRPEELVNLDQPFPCSRVLGFFRPFKIVNNLEELDSELFDSKSGLGFKIPFCPLPEIIKISSKTEKPVVQVLVSLCSSSKEGVRSSGNDSSFFS